MNPTANVTSRILTTPSPVTSADSAWHSSRVVLLSVIESVIRIKSKMFKTPVGKKKSTAYKKFGACQGFANLSVFCRCYRVGTIKVDISSSSGRAQVDVDSNARLAVEKREIERNYVGAEQDSTRQNAVFTIFCCLEH